MRTRSFPFPFFVADIKSGPDIRWSDGRLSVLFTDYCGMLCKMQFEDVSHFEMLVEDEVPDCGYQIDGVREVIESPLVARLVEIGDIPNEEAPLFRHVVIGFNVIGAYLSLVFRSFRCEPSS